MSETYDVPVVFECQLDIFDRESFQREGHMLFDLYTPNPREGEPDIKRPWNGDKIFALRLMYKGEQVHRAMSDSLGDAERLMSASLKNLALGQFAVQFAQKFNYEQFERLNKERAEFAEWIQETFKEEIKAGKHASMESPFAAAKFYLQKAQTPRRKAK